MSAKVLIYRPTDESGASHELLASSGAEVVVGPLEHGAIPHSLTDAAALLGSTFQAGVMDAGFLDAFPQLRLVSKYTIGFDDVDLDAASERGILVTHCPTEANYGGVAEGTMALMLAFLKKLRERDRHVKGGGWRDNALRGRYLGRRDDGYGGITVGIVGLGRIGTRVAELLRPWRVRLLACDPWIGADAFALAGALQTDLQSLLRESDVVSLHCSLNVQTRSLIDAAALALMKDGALLINTARGPMVQLEALVAAIESGRLAGAALDVFENEPLPAGSPILELGDRVLLGPHMVAANEGGTLDAAIPWATRAVLDALAGIEPARVVNPEALERWHSRFGGRSLLE